MFQIEEIQDAGFNAIQLKNSDRSCFTTIVPDCGAMLRAYTVTDADGTSINIIDSYRDKDEFDHFAEPGGFKGLKLSPYPCRIVNGGYQFENKEYQFTEGKPGYENIHGFLYNKAFCVTDRITGPESASIRLKYEYTGNNNGFPFPYLCTVTYTLHTGNKLEVCTTVTNTGSGNLPVADGWHPYFSFGKPVDQLQLQFAGPQMVEFQNLVPTGRLLPNTHFSSAEHIGSRDLDNSFVLDFSAAAPHCLLQDPASGWRLSIQPGESYPYLQIYIPPHRNSIAIENLSAPPNSFNNGIGLKVLQPGESVRFNTGYTLQKIMFT